MRGSGKVERVLDFEKREQYKIKNYSEKIEDEDWLNLLQEKLNGY